MKNLELFEISRNIPRFPFENVSCIAYDGDGTIFALKYSQLLILSNCGEIIQEFDIPACDCLTQLEFLDFDRRLWFGTGAQFITVNWCESTQCYALQVIEHPFEFEAAVWNPAQDSIAVVASDGKVGVYTVDFEEKILLPLQESHLSNCSENEFVAVGWGSAETQFRGKAGKAAVVEEEELGVTDDDRKPRISWRGNGEMFAVNYYNNGKRKFKVFRYPCELIHESPSITGLLPVIAWKPQGNRIACVVWTNKRCELTLCEKNGFLKDKFELVKQEKVDDLKWSPCGEVLAVCQLDGKSSSVDLYTMKNYVWYLKQRLNFAYFLLKLEFLLSPCTKIVIRSTMKSGTITYSFKYALHSTSAFTQSQVTCASINGASVYLTHSEYGVKPPPMCDSVVVTEAPVNFVIFNPEKAQMGFVDSNNKITIYDVIEKGLKKVGTYCLAHDDDHRLPLMFHHFVWQTDKAILCLKEVEDVNLGTHRFILNMNDQNNWTSSPALKGTNYMDVTPEGEIIQQSVDVVAKITISNDEIETLVELPTPALYIKLFEVNRKRYVFSLTSTGNFFINETEILQGVISFIIHDKYLFLTTNQNKLIGVRLNEPSLEDLCRLKLNFYTRPVEPGSYLLFGIPQTSSVAMQIPRGNIETCTCQIISVDRLESLIQLNAWDKAMDLVRIEKLVTSTIVDLNVDRFLNSVDQFIQTVENPAVLSDFLLGLQKDNVFETIYRTCGIPTPVKTEKKIELVCDAIIEYMQQNNYGYYISCIIIACFMKNSPTSTREALHHVRNLLDFANKDPSAIKVAEEALKNVSTLKPSGEIYQTALGMYDLNLALFVARNIEMDPKEYEPFIYHLKSVDEIVCRFKVNDFLKQHGLAVRYLVRCAADVDEALRYIEEHGVYKEAYESVPPKSELGVEVTRLYAKYLARRHSYEEAAILLQRAALLAEAMENYKKANCWKEAIAIMQTLNLSQEIRHVHLTDIIWGLVKENRIVEASSIYDIYLSNYENAVALLIAHKMFKEAVQLAQKYNRTDIYESDIYVGILDYCRYLCSKLEEMKIAFTNYKARLHEIRIQKLAKFEASAGQETYFNTAPGFENDTLSFAGTNASTISTRTSGTRSSSMSSRNRRKEERKKQDLRQGGFYEDIALIRALYNLIYEVFELGPQTRELCMIGLNMDVNVQSEIKSLHNSLLQLQTLMENSLKNIWPPNLNSPKDDEEGQAKFVHENINALDVKYRGPPNNVSMKWSLSILGGN